AVSRRVLDGTVPVLTAAPPRTASRSTSRTRLPKYAAWAAPFSPAGPDPITTRSYGDVGIILRPNRGPIFGRGGRRCQPGSSFARTARIEARARPLPRFLHTRKLKHHNSSRVPVAPRDSLYCSSP